MNEIQTAILSLLPPKRKQTPSGWTSINAVCCHHNGQRKDTRSRGGILLTSTAGFNYHCFNCNFKAGWSPGKLLSNNAKKLFKWMGLSDSDIGKLNLVALKIKDSQPISSIPALDFNLKQIALPDNTKSIDQWIAEGCQEPELLQVIDYVINQRGMHWDWYPWHWCNANGYRDRVIVPFYNDGNQVGYTGRLIREGRPKYLTESQPGLVFNMDRQTYNRKYVIVVEGQFDAIAIDGVAIMTNDPNELQAARINNLNREVICVPDRDQAGSQMLLQAAKNNWSVSCPPWQSDVKDVADAVKRYGRLYTLTTILHYRVQGEIKIQLLRNKLRSLND